MSKMYYGVVYKIVCNLSSKLYIGQTIQSSISHRLSSHCYDALSGRKGANCKLSNAIRKYGKENFYISIICSANSKEELNDREKLCIRLFKTIERGYNIAEGGLNQRHSEESKKKMSLIGKGKKKPPGFSEKLRIANLGKKKPQWVIEKMSQSQLGEKSVWFGKFHSEETKQKMSKNNANNRKILCIETNIEYDSIAIASRKLGISRPYLNCHLLGKYKSVKKLHFKYV